MRENNIHNRIARIRFELGLNQKEFAEKLNVTQSTISKYEKNERTPDYSFLENLVNEFNVNPMYLFDKSEDIFLK